MFCKPFVKHYKFFYLKTMNSNQIKKFIMFYERLTKHMLKNFSKKAKIVIKIDEKHRLKTVSIN